MTTSLSNAFRHEPPSPLIVTSHWFEKSLERTGEIISPLKWNCDSRRYTSSIYGVVRHPMYACAVLLMVGMPLWLESYAAAAPAAVPIAMVVVRILIEERFLKRGLMGYEDYPQQGRAQL